MDESAASGRPPPPPAPPGTTAQVAPGATIPPPPPADVLPPETPLAEGGGFKMLRPLRYRDFGLLWTGMTVSLLGDGIFYVALAWKILNLSEGAGSLAIFGVAWTAPQVLFALVGGVLSDRLDRRVVMIGADAIRGVAIALLGSLAISGALELWHIYLLAAVYGTGDAFFAPAFQAIVPDIVPKGMLAQANALDQFVRPITLMLIGPAIGGVMVAAFGAGTALLVDAGTFAISALAVSAMRTRRTRSSDYVAPNSILTEVVEGLKFVTRQTWLWAGLIASAVGLLAFYGPNRVLVPLIVKEEIRGGAGDLGLVYSAGGVGAVLASVVIGQRGLPRKHVTFMFATWAAATFSLAFYAIATHTWHAMATSFVMTAAGTIGVIIWFTLLQTLVPSDLLGRVSSLDWLMSTALIPVSFALSYPISQAIGVQETLLWGGLIGGSVFLFILLVPGVRKVEETEI